MVTRAQHPDFRIDDFAEAKMLWFAIMALGGTIVGGTIVILVLMPVRGKSDEPVDDMEATMAVNSVQSPRMSFLLQLTLCLVMTVSLILAIWVRLTGAGWYIIFCGIPLLLLAALHFGVQVTAIRKASKMKRSYIPLILLSNLFLFLGFALQVDGGDTPGVYLAIAVFYGMYFKKGSMNPLPDGQVSIYMYTSIAFLIALVVSWFLLLGKSFRKQRTMLERSH